MSEQEMTIGFIGNTNCGKTTLFNAYTGANLKVANWPGVTVEKVEGVMKDHDLTIHLVDLPGTYSLTSYTMEETVSRQFILSDEVDVIINVVDASALERSLYLTLQLLELGKPVVLALNMMDIVEKRGMEIDLHRLPEMLGIPVIPVSARKRRGLDILLHAAAHHKDCTDPDCLIHHHKVCSKHRHDHHSEYAMVYSDEIEDKIDQIMPELKRRYPDLTNYRWHALKLLEADKEITEKYPVELPQVLDRSYESDIINQKYDFIGEIIGEVLLHKERQDLLTERADRLLTSKVWSIPIFLGIMAVTFFLTFTIGDWIKGYFELGIDWLSGVAQSGLTAVHAGTILTSLMVDGIIGGVGTIVTFLPNILILFLCLALLEDSGYMKNYIIKPLGEMYMEEVISDDIRLALVPLSKKSEGLYNKINMLLKCVFYSAERSQIIEHNPCEGISGKGGKPAKKREALTDQQVAVLLDTVKGLPPYLFIMIGLYSGLRREEILALQWDCVFLDESTSYISVRRAWRTEHNRPVISTVLKTKAAKRDIPIPKCLVNCLREAKENSISDYVIADSNGEPLAASQFQRVWQYVVVVRSTKPRNYYKYVNGQSIKYTVTPTLGMTQKNQPKIRYTLDFDVTPHQLRHTYITNLLYAGVDPKTVQYLAGHENSKTTMDIYAKVKYNKPEELFGVVNGAFHQAPAQ